MSSAAVFDLDNTLVRGSFLFHFGVEMVRRGILNPVHVLPFALTEFRYARRRQESAGIPERIARCTLRLARDRQQQHLIELADEFTRKRLDRFQMLQIATLARSMQGQGISVYLATASPQELAQCVSDRLGLSGAIGTVGEVVDGRYTGRLGSPIAHGAMKALRVAELLDDRGHDPRTCWAFSDSVNDLPLLTLVGQPVAVGPDRHLRKVAEQNGWPVLLGQAEDDSPLPGWELIAPALAQLRSASGLEITATRGRVVATRAARGSDWTAVAAIHPCR